MRICEDEGVSGKEKLRIQKYTGRCGRGAGHARNLAVRRQSLKADFHIIVWIVWTAPIAKTVLARSIRLYGNTSQAIVGDSNDRGDHDRLDRTMLYPGDRDVRVQSYWNIHRRFGRSGRSECTPECIGTGTGFQVTLSTVFMKEVRIHDYLHNKFTKKYINRHTRQNCWKKNREKFWITLEDLCCRFVIFFLALVCRNRARSKKKEKKQHRRSLALRFTAAIKWYSGPTMHNYKRSNGNMRSHRIVWIACIARAHFKAFWAIHAIVTSIWKPVFRRKQARQLVRRIT